jgi:HK97 family phage portal protein
VVNLGQRIKLAAGVMTGLWPRWGGRGNASVRLLLPGARFDYETEAGSLWANSVVALGLRWIADRAHKPPVRVSRIDRNGDYVPIQRHPLCDLWNRPNAFQTRRIIEAAVALSLVCDGNGYLHKRRSKGGKLIDLWWMPHSTVEPQWPEDGSAFIDSYRVEVDGYQRDLPREDVIHFQTGIDPANPRLGYAPLKACLREVCSTNEESAYVAALLRNAGVPGLMIVPDSEYTQPDSADAERIKERIRDSFSGDNRGDAIVLAAKYKIEQVGFSPEQLALDKLPAQAIAKVAAAVGVPAMALGLPDPNKTYANLEEASRQAWAVVSALQDAIAETLRYNLLAEFGTDPLTHVVEYDYSGIAELNEATTSLHDRVRQDVVAGILTVNEGRELIGFEPMYGGDALAGLPAEPGTEGADVVAAATSASIQDTALNGAQVQSLVEIVSQVVAGQLPADSAAAIIAAAFPNLDSEEIGQIISPIAAFTPKPTEPTPDQPPPNGDGAKLWTY